MLFKMNVNILEVKLLYGKFSWDSQIGKYVRNYVSNVKPTKMIYIKYDTSDNLDWYVLTDDVDHFSNRIQYSYRNHGLFFFPAKDWNVFNISLYIHGYNLDSPKSVKKIKEYYYEITYESGYKSNKYNLRVNLINKPRFFDKHISKQFKISDILYTKSDNTCAICLDKVDMNDLEILLCGHQYHTKCINYLQNYTDEYNIKCPQCNEISF